jgi:hypothetical protein
MVTGANAPAYRNFSEGRRSSGVSWVAIFAGTVATATLSPVLLLLGTGLGFSSTSPWGNRGVSAAMNGIATIVWLTFTQLAASGMGGYLSGRLRTKWAEVHTDEVFFRDTAHGFLAWAVATLLTAALGVCGQLGDWSWRASRRHGGGWRSFRCGDGRCRCYRCSRRFGQFIGPDELLR